VLRREQFPGTDVPERTLVAAVTSTGDWLCVARRKSQEFVEFSDVSYCLQDKARFQRRAALI
jgi:hypothetical protein